MKAASVLVLDHQKFLPQSRDTEMRACPQRHPEACQQPAEVPGISDVSECTGPFMHAASSIANKSRPSRGMPSQNHQVSPWSQPHRATDAAETHRQCPRWGDDPRLDGRASIAPGSRHRRAIGLQRVGGRGPGSRGSPEELRAALRVIDRNTQDQGRGGGKDAPEVMP